MKLRLTSRARDDIIAVGDYLKSRNPAAAFHVRDAIEAGFGLLRTYKEAGRLLGRGVRRLTLPRYPYLIFYRIDRVRAEIVVLTIRHGARKPFA